LDDTRIRIHRKAKYIIDRYAKLHYQKSIQFYDQIAQLIANTLDGIDDPEWTIEDLREHYSHSDIIVAADIRKWFSPEGEKP
jgi:uncharacterized protein (UPF0305 family)